MENDIEQSARAAGFPNDDQRWRGKGRAPFQILVLPFHFDGQRIKYAIFKRADAGYWQFIAGGGEGSELPIEAARREAGEEAAIPPSTVFFPLDSRCTVPVMETFGRLRWGEGILVVPEYTFAVRITDIELRIGVEHTEYQWMEYEPCLDMLHWDSNRNALHELNHRLLHDMMTAHCFGGIIFDHGHVLLRKPAGGHGGFAWTFAKGTPRQEETPEETALREVLEETGFQCRIVCPISGGFESETCLTRYFLMRPVGQPKEFDSETAEVRWVSVADAKRLLGQSTTIKGRDRDLAALDAALIMNRNPQLNFRQMESGDIACCIRIRTNVRENQYSVEGLAKIGITEDSVNRMLGTTHGGWVCEVDGRVVGFSMGNRTTCEFWVVAVLPEYEGQGIGTRLTVLALEWLWVNGCEEVWLWTSPETSTRAYALYNKLGWRDCGIANGQRIMKLRQSDLVK